MPSPAPSGQGRPSSGRWPPRTRAKGRHPGRPPARERPPALTAVDPAVRSPTPTAGWYARAVVALRWPVVVGWILLAVLATSVLPDVSGSDSGELEGFVPEDSPYVEVELESVREFGFPLLSRTMIVQRDPEGLSPYAQAEAVLRGVALTQKAYPDAGPIRGALPLVNTLGIVPGSQEQGTTALTYLFMPPWTGFATQQRAAESFAAEHLSDPDDAYVGVTGSIPARAEQQRIVEDSLRLVELSTVGAIVLIVALNFGSIVAPVIALGTAALSFVIVLRVGAWLGELVGISIPTELRPLVLALMLGVVTDYAIFFMSGVQHPLRRGAGRLVAARTATAEFAPIVTVAGITVAAGTASLLAAESTFFRAFGPGLALTVVVALVVSVTLVPALLAILGRGTFWPGRPPAASDPEQLPQRSGGEMPGPGPARLANRAFRGGGVVLMTRRPVAAVIVAGCTLALLLAAVPLKDLRLGLGFVPSLPGTSTAAQAADAASAGFAPGILSPTELLLQGEDLDARQDELRQLGRLIAAEPGVAGVIGPGTFPDDLEEGVLVTYAGDAARFLVVLGDEPLGASGIDTFQRLEEWVPHFLDQVGLTDVEHGFAGDTALAYQLVSDTAGDLERIATAALLVNLLLLVMFLRALVAPVYLLATSVLALCASLGLATWLFQDVLGHDGITFYVPFAAAVLLVALGSDYNIFGVGHIWGVARRLPLREAIIEAVPRTTRAINAAAITLAVSFGLLALVPLRPFRELGFIMGVGIILDAVVVRTFLVPTLLVLVGRLSWWPATPRRRETRAQPPGEPPAGAASGSRAATGPPGSTASTLAPTAPDAVRTEGGS